MRIGALTLVLAASRPADLDAQLVAATGCASAEIATILSAGPDRAAAALRPFLGGPEPEHRELARAIASDPSAVIAIADHYRALATDPARGEIEPEAIVSGEDADV